MKLANAVQLNRAGVGELMSEAYSFASYLRDIRDDRLTGDLQNDVAYAAHKCRDLLERLERAYQELAGGRHVPTRKELYEQGERKRNRVSEADREVFEELVTFFEKHIPRLSPEWRHRFTKSRNGFAKKLAESDARELHLVNGGE